MAGEGAVHAWLVREGAHHDFVTWAEPFASDVVKLWDSCPRGDWLLALASRLRAPTRLLVVAACDCARRALEGLPDDSSDARACLETIRAWAGSARPPLTLEELESMRGRLEAARDAAHDAAEAEAMLAAVAAFETIGDPAYAASAAAFAAHACLVSAADCAMEQALRFAHHEGAEAVRTVLPSAAIAALWAQR